MIYNVLCQVECAVPQFKGDTYCDDQNNNAGCDWDGGDCCGEEVSTLYCTVCECLEESEGWFRRINILFHNSNYIISTFTKCDSKHVLSSANVNTIF